MIQSAVIPVARVSCILNNPERCKRYRPEALNKRHAITTGACMQKINTIIAIIVYFLSERALISMQYTKGPF